MHGLCISHSISLYKGLKELTFQDKHLSGKHLQSGNRYQKSQQRLLPFQKCISVFPNISKWFIRKDMFKYIVLNIQGKGHHWNDLKTHTNLHLSQHSQTSLYILHLGLTANSIFPIYICNNRAQNASFSIQIQITASWLSSPPLMTGVTK